MNDDYRRVQSFMLHGTGPLGECCMTDNHGSHACKHASASESMAAAACLLQHGQNSQISRETAAHLLSGAPVSNDQMSGGTKPKAAWEVAV